MKKTYVTLLIVLIMLVTASIAYASPAAASDNFAVPLSVREEVPARDTNATGVATFKLSEGGTQLTYKLIVANIQGVTQAHIHCGTPDVAGPVVVFLYGFNPVGVTVNGILAEGTITQANVIARPDSAACPGGVSTLADVIAKMRSGGAYANVHTLEFPAGEERGTIH